MKTADDNFRDTAKLIQAAKNACTERDVVYQFTCPLCGYKKAQAILTSFERMMVECAKCGRTAAL